MFTAATAEAPFCLSFEHQHDSNGKKTEKALRKTFLYQVTFCLPAARAPFRLLRSFFSAAAAVVGAGACCNTFSLPLFPGQRTSC